MKASLKNDTVELEWKEGRVQALRARQQKREIALEAAYAFLVKATREKLSKYYGITDSIEGDLYTIGTILGLANKLQFFLIKD